MIGLVLRGVLVASSSLKMMTTDKLNQRNNYLLLYVNLHTEFNFARYQTTLFVEFWFRKNRSTYDETHPTTTKRHKSSIVFLLNDNE